MTVTSTLTTAPAASSPPISAGVTRPGAFMSPKRYYHGSLHRNTSVPFSNLPPINAEPLNALAAQLKRNKFIGQVGAMAYDFDLSHGSSDVLYATFRMGPRQDLVFRIGPEMIMRHAIDRCLETWRHPDGRKFMAWELFFYLPCNTRIDYYKPLTAAELGVEDHDLIDVFSESHGG